MAEADGNRTRPPRITRRTGFEGLSVPRPSSGSLTRTYVFASAPKSAKDWCGVSSPNLVEKTCPVTLRSQDLSGVHLLRYSSNTPRVNSSNCSKA
jgi:hypothetical protein